MVKKHPFMCENCGSECMIYKKGKSHRVFVCPKCGVLATNGKGLLKKIGKGAIRGVPFVGDVLAEVLTKDQKPTPSQSPTFKTQRRDNSLEKIKYALGGK